MAKNGFSVIYVVKVLNWIDCMDDEKKKKKEKLFLLLAGVVPTDQPFSVDDEKKGEIKIGISPNIDPRSVFKRQKKEKKPYWLRKHKHR